MLDVVSRLTLLGTRSWATAARIGRGYSRLALAMASLMVVGAAVASAQGSAPSPVENGANALEYIIIWIVCPLGGLACLVAGAFKLRGDHHGGGGGAVKEFSAAVILIGITAVWSWVRSLA